MRVTKTTNRLKVHAVAGTYVVSLGFDLPKQSCKGLRGFAVHRVDHTSGEAAYMDGMKAFADTDPGFPAPARRCSRSCLVTSGRAAEGTGGSAAR